MVLSGYMPRSEIAGSYVCVSCSVMSDSLQPHGLQPTRLLCLWNSLGKNTRVGCHFLLQGIFLTQGLNPGLLHCRQTLYHLSHQGSRIIWQLCFQYFEEPPYCFPWWLHQFTLPLTVQGSKSVSCLLVSNTLQPRGLQPMCRIMPFSLHLLQHLSFVVFSDGQSDWYEKVPRCSFDLHLSNN